MSEISLRHMFFGQISRVQKSLVQMSRGQMSLGQMSREQMSVDKCPVNKCPLNKCPRSIFTSHCPPVLVSRFPWSPWTFVWAPRKGKYLSTVWSNQTETIRKQTVSQAYNIKSTRLDKLWAKNRHDNGRVWIFRNKMRSLVQKL